MNYKNEFSNIFKYVLFSIFEDQNNGKAHNPNGNVLPFFTCLIKKYQQY
jgi:hypothetical protein